MKSIQVDNATPFIQKELKKIHKKVEPLLKKNMMFSFISFPMIVFSIFNLYLLIFYNNTGENVTGSIILFSVITAIGFALLKETRLNNKEIQKRSIAHITKKINTSQLINDYSKKHYLQKLKQQPSHAMEIFFEFLSQEEQNKNKSSENQ